MNAFEYDSLPEGLILLDSYEMQIDNELEVKRKGVRVI